MSETLRKLTRTSVKVGVLGAGILMIGSSAHADWSTGGSWSTGFNSGAGAGLQTFDGVQAPVNTCGTAVGAEGDANAFCVGGSSATFDISSFQNWSSGFNSGELSGEQTFALTQAPVNTCGTAVAGLGEVNAACVGGASSVIESTRAEDFNTGFNSGAAAGNQTFAPIMAPINICGTAVSAIGEATAGCIGGASASFNPAGLGDLNTGFNTGIGSGNQTVTILQAPVNVCGNAVAAAGDASAFCVGGSSATIGQTGDDQAWNQANKTAANKATVKKAPAKKGHESARTELLGLNSLTNLLPVGGLTSGLGGEQRAAAPANSAKSAKSAKNGWGDAGPTCNISQWSGLNGGVGAGTQVFAPVQTNTSTSTQTTGTEDQSAIVSQSNSFC